MTQNLFNGLPPRVVTYIKIHLRYIFSTGLFSYQEREDLIQDLVLFYLERFYRKKEVPDDYLFVSIKTKAQQILRTRLRQLQSTEEQMQDCWQPRSWLLQIRSFLRNSKNTAGN